MTRFKRIEQNKKISAILSADWHLRPDIPVCRTDDYFKAMERKVDFILALSQQHNCPILIAGDLGHKAQWPNWLLEWAIKKFKANEIICIPGQHDLPNHRIDMFEKSGIGVLYAAGAIKLIGMTEKEDRIHSNLTIIPFPYGHGISHFKIEVRNLIAMAHQMILENAPIFPGQEAPKGNQLIKQFPEYSLIISGDNHHPFTVEYQGRWLVNPGSLMRNTTDQEDHRPRVYLWYAESNEIEPIYLPIEQGVISREHIETAKNRDNRMDAFVKRVQEDVEIELSYEQNLMAYFQKYRTEMPVKDKVMEAVR